MANCYKSPFWGKKIKFLFRKNSGNDPSFHHENLFVSLTTCFSGVDGSESGL
jgi:hypothetical protein